MNGKNLIFLISQPRAGSTMLQRLLQAHREIHTMAEPWIMLHPLYGLKREGLSAEYNAAWANDAVKDFYLKLPRGEESYFEGLRHMYGHLYQQVLETSKSKYFLDKTPRYYHIIPELIRTFPEAKFVILLRNPLAVIASILATWIKQDYSKLRNFKHDLLDAPQLLLQGTELLKERSLSIVFYEQLLANPAAELTKICQQLELEFAPEMLACQPLEGKGFGYRDQSSKMLSSGLISTNSNKWMLKFEHPQVWQIGSDYLELLGKDTVDAMGYSYTDLAECLKSKRPSRFDLSSRFPLDWCLMSETEKRASRKKYLFARAVQKIESFRQESDFDRQNEQAKTSFSQSF